MLNIFSPKIKKRQQISRQTDTLDYTLPLGLPNLGNTCYMNSLLQALTGCPAFTAYVDRIWNHMKLDVDDTNSVVVFMLIKTLKDLKEGSPEAQETASELHKVLCNAENEEDSQPFSRLFEQQDCHDLMFYLLEKITMITAKFSR
jgi:ubiquitin carboxyl-terminal hydrolase 30